LIFEMILTLSFLKNSIDSNDDSHNTYISKIY